MGEIINLTAEEKELIRKGKIYHAGKQHSYHQALLKCHYELEEVFENGYECLELEELHGHVIKELYRVEDELGIPRFDQEATDFMEEVFGHLRTDEKE